MFWELSVLDLDIISSCFRVRVLELGFRVGSTIQVYRHCVLYTKP